MSLPPPGLSVWSAPVPALSAFALPLAGIGSLRCCMHVMLGQDSAPSIFSVVSSQNNCTRRRCGGVVTAMLAVNNGCMDAHVKVHADTLVFVDAS